MSRCQLPVYDLGIVLGAAVTDLVRTFDQKPFRMEDHVRRFYRSCQYAYIEPPVSMDESMAISMKLIEHNGALAPGGELAVIYYITAGQALIYAGSAGAAGSGAQSTPSYVQHTFVLPFHLWRDLFLNGAHCITPAQRHWPPQSLSSKIKNRNRLHMWIGDRQAQLADPNAIALYLDLDGNVTETGGSNFVIYRDGKVISPRRNNILWGVSLEVLGEILEGLGVPFVEQDIQTYDVMTADEAWLTTSPYCVGPVVKINGAPVGDGKPGALWRRVLESWSAIVGKDVYEQVVEAQAEA